MKKQYGFTLVEMAIVLVIVGVILGGMFSGLSAMRETSKFKEDQQKLQDIKSALLSFAAINNRLPCPDSDNDGQENLNGDFCQQDYGTLPHADLGTHATNAYGLAFSYQVNRQADTSDANDSANSASYFGVCTDGACFEKDTPPKSGTPGAGNFTVEDGSSNNLAIHIPLLVISHGQNGCPSSRSSEESNNCSNLETTTTYYQAPQNRDSFDDVLIWLSSLEIKAATPEILAFNSTNIGSGNDGDSGENSGSSSSYSPTTDLSDTDLLDDTSYDPNGHGTHNNDNAVITDGEAWLGTIAGDIEMNGDNIVRSDALHNNGNLYLNCGDNIIQFDGTLAGEITEDSECDPSGNNAIRIGGDLHNNGRIELEDGQNKVYIHQTIAGQISFGSGDNIVFINGNFHNNGRIYGSGGKLYTNLNPAPSSPKITGFSEVIYCNDPDMNCP